MSDPHGDEPRTATLAPPAPAAGAPRLALVVQRYAQEISGGAERHAMLVAELLARDYDIEVLTSCALDYTRWAMDFAPGRSQVGGVQVLRFAHPERNDIGRARVPLVHKLRFKLRKLLRLLPGPLVLQARGDPQVDGQQFLRRQGPHCAGLFEHLAASHRRYDAVIFFTALYEPAAVGIQQWGRRSILVPLLHDEKPMYLPVFRDVLRSAGAILFNADAERRLAARMYGIDTAHCAIAGVGIEAEVPDPALLARLRVQYGLRPGYLVYVGRVDRAKNCDELLSAFLDLARDDHAVQLVLVGQSVMAVPQHPRIVQTGFVSGAERDALVAGAAALVLASRYESLSMVVLEALLLHTPVIVNGACEVLADHIRLSAAGVAYDGRRGLAAAMRDMAHLPSAQRQALGARGAAYVLEHYTWARVMAEYHRAIAAVTQAAAQPAASHPPALR